MYSTSASASLPNFFSLLRLEALKTIFSCNQCGGGQGGGSPGEQGAGGVRETGEERAGGGISTMAGSRREIQKGKLLLFLTAYFQSKKRTQEHFLTSI